MTYVIDMHVPTTHLIPCSLKESTVVPGMWLCVMENGWALVVQPDGNIRMKGTVPDLEPPSSPNFDSAWTQAAYLAGDKLVYRSSGGVPRGFLVIK
jgi:hypothetical protein